MLTPEEEAELAALAAWLPTAWLPVGGYAVGPGVVAADPMRSHACLRRAWERGVQGQQRRALLARLRALYQIVGPTPRPATPRPGETRRVGIFDGVPDVTG